MSANTDGEVAQGIFLLKWSSPLPDQYMFVQDEGFQPGE